MENICPGVCLGENEGLEDSQVHVATFYPQHTAPRPAQGKNQDMLMPSRGLRHSQGQAGAESLPSSMSPSYGRHPNKTRVNPTGKC